MTRDPHIDLMGQRGVWSDPGEIFGFLQEQVRSIKLFLESRQVERTLECGLVRDLITKERSDRELGLKMVMDDCCRKMDHECMKCISDAQKACHVQVRDDSAQQIKIDSIQSQLDHYFIGLFHVRKSYEHCDPLRNMASGVFPADKAVAKEVAARRYNEFLGPKALQDGKARNRVEVEAPAMAWGAGSLPPTRGGIGDLGPVSPGNSGRPSTSHVVGHDPLAVSQAPMSSMFKPQSARGRSGGSDRRREAVPGGPPSAGTGRRLADEARARDAGLIGNMPPARAGQPHERFDGNTVQLFKRFEEAYQRNQAFDGAMTHQGLSQVFRDVGAHGPRGNEPAAHPSFLAEAVGETVTYPRALHVFLKHNVDPHAVFDMRAHRHPLVSLPDYVRVACDGLWCDGTAVVTGPGIRAFGCACLCDFVLCMDCLRRHQRP